MSDIKRPAKKKSARPAAKPNGNHDGGARKNAGSTLQIQSGPRSTTDKVAKKKKFVKKKTNKPVLKDPLKSPKVATPGKKAPDEKASKKKTGKNLPAKKKPTKKKKAKAIASSFFEKPHNVKSLRSVESAAASKPTEEDYRVVAESEILDNEAISDESYSDQQVESDYKSNTKPHFKSAAKSLGLDLEASGELKVEQAVDETLNLAAEEPTPTNAFELCDLYHSDSPYVVEGLFRQGEVVNTIGSTKQGKSWLMLGMALSIASGTPWLGRSVTQGKVAILDNELTPESLASRIRIVSNAMGISNKVLRDNVIVIPLRYSEAPLKFVLFDLLMRSKEYRWIGLDCLYQFLTARHSELDIQEIVKFYRLVGRFARKTKAAVQINHHATKGDQSSKAVTDIGSGSGAISRAADTHITLRGHAKEVNLAVMDIVCRSSAKPPTKTIGFKFPLWSLRDDVAPELGGNVKQTQSKQTEKDAEMVKRVAKLLKDSGEWMTAYKVRDALGIGQARAESSLNRLVAAKEVTTTERPVKKSNGRKVTLYRIAQSLKLD